MNEIYIIIILLSLDYSKAGDNGNISNENENIWDENNYMFRLLKISFVFDPLYFYSVIK